MIVISWKTKTYKKGFTTDKQTREDAEKLVRSLKQDGEVKKISAVEVKTQTAILTERG